jgi:trehalose/maltose hydrolase-like predicted phosphorylase
MFVPFHDDGAVISQFEGYDQLVELDWDAYHERYGPSIQRLDRILRAENDDPGRYKVAKQADTVMLFFLFSEDTLMTLFERLGYEFSPEMIPRNVAYYDRRTSHGSTLSVITHAGALAAVDPEGAWEGFRSALDSDVGDVQGGTTREGIHLGVMAGTLDLVQRAFLGAEIRGDALTFAPRLAHHLNGLSFQAQFRGASIRVSIDGASITIAVLGEGQGGPVRVGVGRDVRELRAGQRCSFELSRTTASREEEQPNDLRRF